MARAEFGHAQERPTPAPGVQVQRTQYMLAVTSAASVVILVVAALFISLF